MDSERRIMMDEYADVVEAERRAFEDGFHRGRQAALEVLEEEAEWFRHKGDDNRESHVHGIAAKVRLLKP